MHQDRASHFGTRTEVESQFARDQLLLRYAAGRVGHFGNRQVMTLGGGLVLAVISSPVVGFMAVMLALLGEAVDCIFLRGIKRRLEAGANLRRQLWISTLTAAFQSLTISGCVILGLTGEISRNAPLFSTAFLAGAALNAGLVYAYHPAAARARLVIYALVGASYFFLAPIFQGGFSQIYLMNLIGSLILAYIVYTFIGSIRTGFNRNRDNLASVSRHRRDLETINTQLQIRQKEAHMLSLVARNANDSVVVSNPDGKISWVNEAFTRITGYTRHEAYGHRAGEILNAPNTCLETVGKLLEAQKQGHPFRGEIQNQTKDGRIIWMETNQVPVLDPDGTVEVIVAIERDITETKQTARDLAKAKRVAEDAARSKSDFLATMSHEIRTPMNGIMGMADLISETDLTVEQREYADTIRNSAQALLTIINDILDLSKMEAGKMSLHKVDFDLRACLHDTTRLLQAQAIEKGLYLHLEIAPYIPRRVCGDDGRIRQVLINLIGNALKFTQKGGVTVCVEGETEGKTARIAMRVRDTGIGIAPDKLALVFEKFSQAEATTTRRFGGTGLGLTISRKLVDAMEGEISVTSELGKGSEFTIRIPLGLAEVTGTSDPDAVNTSKSSIERLEGYKVLVAEDNRVNRLLIERYLKNVPVILEFAHDGQEAVEKQITFAPDLIFMDMSMPVMSGVQATEQIRKSDADHPCIIALTANAFESDREACLAAGMNDFLTKPLKRTQLIATLVRYFEEQHGKETD